MEFMLGGTILFGGTFAPRDWAFCDGQLIQISQKQALFAILGTTWGGDGRVNFGLPDLRGRAPIGQGTAPGLSPSILGRPSGVQTQSLSLSQMPSHSHSATFTATGGSAINATADAKLMASAEVADSTTPGQGDYLAQVVAGGGGPDKAEKIYRAASNTTDTAALVEMAPESVKVDVTVTGGVNGGIVSIDNTGQSEPFSNMQPSLSMNYIIAMEGLFPSRN